MTLSEWRSSIFSNGRDRAPFVAYFLGGVVPLVALGVVIERFALSSRAGASLPYSDLGLIGLLGSMGLLSLGCFFMLRHLVHALVERNRLLAYYDSLTGLPNRRMYEDRLEQALMLARRKGRLVAACFLDLDGFKRINDTLGHGGGDRLLCQVAERLVGSVRPGDAVSRSAESQVAISRLGGDEFTFLLTEISDPRDAAKVASRVLDALREPFELDRHEVFATASIGIAMFPSDGEDVETLLGRADAAMYWAKDRGRNNYQFYAPRMNQVASRRVDLERRLRRALVDEDFSLHYQPVRDSVSGRLTATEALLRWEDPSRGSMSPEEFIPIAEETGLIAEIGEWVLRSACEQAQAWQASGLRPIRLAVNLSGHQLRQPTLIETVARVLQETGLSPAHLELELTESTVMQDDDVTIRSLRALSEMGIGLALDDFGTGYSSLSYLRRFPISRVKIDRSFVAGVTTDRDDAELTAAIISMAHSLRLGVVAEGVETPEQADFLRERGCDELQGFLLGRPSSAETFVRLMEREKST